MSLSTVQKAALLKKAHQREIYLSEMNEILQECKKSNRSLSTEEETTFSDLEKKVQAVDSELEKHNTSLEELIDQMDDLEKRFKATTKPEKKEKKVEKRSVNPEEVRSYKKGESFGNGSNQVTIGDIIVAHTTGRFRSPEVRDLITTNSGGVTISSEVFAGFIDLLRDQSFINEFTVYNMTSKTLTVPRVTGDVLPHFKLESAEITPSNPVFTGVTLESKFLYCLTEISLELLESSTIDIGAAVNEIMIKSMMSSIQKYALTGDVNGFTGILNDPAINTINNTVSYASIGAGIQAVQAVNGVANSLVINPTDSMNLQLLTDGAGGQFITPPSFLDNMNIIVTNAIDEGQALVGDLSTVGMGILSQNGVQLDISKDAGFTRGVVHVRTRFSGDVVLQDPKQLALIGAVV